MDITGPLMLAAAVELVPASALPVRLRERIGMGEDDWALTRVGHRSTSKIVDASTAALLDEFRTPRPIVEAIVAYCIRRRADPHATLTAAYPLLCRLVEEGLLTGADEGQRQLEPAFAPGAVVDGYTIRECLRLVDDTQVFRAETTDGQLVALKLAPTAGTPAAQASFDREAALLSRLAGEVAPALLAVGQTAHCRYLVLEWCAGEDVLEYAESLGRNPRDRLRLGCTVLEAFAVLHARGMVHADVRPENIRVDDAGVVRVIDFGFARLQAGAQPAGEPPRVGPDFFSPPEAAAAWRTGHTPPPADCVAEQYSLAVLVYVLITGNYPCDFSLQRQQLLEQICEASPLPFVGHWPAIEAVLGRALQKDPARRYASVADFAAALAAAAAVPEAPARATCDSSDFVAATLARFGLGGPLLPEGLTAAPTASFMYGGAGIAWALLRMACLRDDPRLLALADLWISRAVADLERPDALYSPELPLPREKIACSSPYHSAAGVWAVRAMVSRAMGDPQTAAHALDSYLQCCREPSVAVELVFGRAGTLLFTDRLAAEFPERSELAVLADALLTDLWRETGTWEPGLQTLEYLGMAHGWAGLLYATLRRCQSTGAALPEPACERLAALASIAVDEGGERRWPILSRAGRPGRSMGGWCHGSAGYIHLWTLAHGLLGETKYLHLAEGAARHVLAHPTPDAHLCCGLAGQAYGLLTLHSHTGGRDWLTAARAMTEQALRAASATLNEANLFRGCAGVALLAVEQDKPEDTRFPLF
jgi:serine/threonine-protein kinase